MRIKTAASHAEFARAAADWTVAHLRERPRSVLALPTGNTPLGLYAELAERSRAGDASLAEARIFNLDEYLGLPSSDPHSYAAFLHRHVIDPLNLAVENVRLLKGDAADSPAECRAYDAALADCGGIDVCILGLGASGHIAFNEPGATWDLRTHITQLSDTTRAAHARQAAKPWNIPTQGLTMGIRTILDAEHILLLIAGANKQAARGALQRGVPDPEWPVTSLLSHASLTTIELCDAAVCP